MDHDSHLPTGQRREKVVLVTGAGGEMGHGLIEALAGAGRQIVAIDVREPDVCVRGRCRDAFVGDICDAGLLERVHAQYEIGEIFHLAALLSTRGEFAPETAHHVNVGGTLNLLKLAAEQARSHGESVKFMFPSSIAAYGMPTLEAKRANRVVGEDRFLHAHTMYGVNKLAGEELGRYYQDHYRKLAKDRMVRPIDFRSIRFPGIVSSETVPAGGTSDYGPEMIHVVAQGKPYECFVRPDTRIPFMTMPEAIDALLRLAAAPKDRLTRNVYNVAAFSPTAADFERMVKGAWPRAQVSFKPDLGRQAIVDSWPEECDDSAARRDWGWHPTYTFEGAFEKYLLPKIQARYGAAKASAG
jgi:nucleoside-diphosphate-sugar epimerase